MTDISAARTRHFQAFAVLALWGVGAALLLDRSPFGIGESASRALLVLWSFVEDLANPIVTLGAPDVRAAFLLPAGFAFPGNVFAAKLAMLVIVAATAWGLFRWFARDADAEAPMIATGLWLLSPLLLGQTDRLGVAPFLVCLMIAGAFIERSYRAAPMAFGGRYFALMVLGFAAATLHPAGVAFALVITASWLIDPPAPAASAPDATDGEAKPFFATGARVALPLGVIFAAACGAWLSDGWPGVSWIANPAVGAAAAVIGWAGQPLAANTVTWTTGGLVLLLAVASLWLRRKALWTDEFGRMVLAGTAISLVCADAVFAMFLLLIVLYWGFPLLLNMRLARLPGLAGQRGPALLILLVLATLFMSQDRARFTSIRKGPDLTAEDQLIQRVTELVKASAPGVRVASQWPGRTMVACACNTLPLPPVAGDENALLKMLKGVDLIAFDPRDPINQSLSRNLAVLGGARAETVALEPGGVIVRLRNEAAQTPPSPAPQEPQPPEAAPRPPHGA